MNDELVTLPSLPEARARATDPVTSHEAAWSVQNITEKQQAVLEVLKRRPEGWHDGHLVDLYHAMRERSLWTGKEVPRQSDSGIRTRRSELVAMGLVEDSNRRVRLPSGRMAVVWRAK